MRTLFTIFAFVGMWWTGHAQAVEATLQLTVNKTDYVPGEPVILYVSLQNTGDQEVTLPFLLHPDLDFTRYFIRDSATDRVERLLPLVIADMGITMKQFAPGEAVREEVRLLFGRRGWLFGKPGTYEISAKIEGGYYVNKVSIPSNTVTVHIHAPADEATAEAARLFMESRQVGLFLALEGGDHLKDGIQRLEQVATQYPTTPHATYANLALGTRLLDDFANFSEKRLRPKEPAVALTFLEQAKARPVGFYDTMHTYLGLYEAYTQLNQTAQAQTTLNELIQISKTQFENLHPFLEDMMEKKEISLPEAVRPQCLLYGVQRGGDTDFFMLNPSDNSEAVPLGLTYPKQHVSLAIADFDGDGEDEIALAQAQGGHTVTLFKPDGTEIRSFPVVTGGVALAAGDLDGDNRAEIIVASRTSANKELFPYTAEGIPLGPIRMFDKNTRMEPANGDTDGDKRSEVIAGTLLGKDSIAVYNTVSKERYQFPVFQTLSPGKRADGYGVKVATGDLNGDGDTEIVAATAGKDGQVEIYTSDGTLLKTFKAFDTRRGILMTTGNVTGDRQPEIIAAEVNGKEIRGFNSDGDRLFSFQSDGKAAINALATFRCGAQ
jgi:hypothetical protein